MLSDIYEDHSGSLVNLINICVLIYLFLIFIEIYNIV